MATTVTDALVGRLVDGRYEVRSRIARGGMATVYLATDRRLDREVALKVMHPHLADGASGTAFVSRFRREARAAARLTHPGLVAVYDQGVDGETSYLTMEYIDGTNLRRRLRAVEPLTVAESLDVVEHVLDALAAAHRENLVHRDIKPENILLATDGRVKVADFGLARAVTEVTSTTTGTILGTVAYLGPELIATGHCDTRTDVYAVGVMLYEMLTGSQPFVGASPIQVAFQHVNSDVPAPSEVLGWLPAEVDELVCALAARDPEDRPADAPAALAQLRRVRAELSDDVLGRQGGRAADPDQAQESLDSLVPGVVAPGAPHDLPADAAPADAARAGAAETPDSTHDISALLDATSRPAPTGGTTDDSDGDQATEALWNRSHGSTIALQVAAARPAELTAPVAPDDAAAGPGPGRRRRRALAWVLGVVLLLGAAGGGGTYWWYSAGPGHYTEVPAGLTGAAAEDASAALTTAGLDVTTTPAYNDTVAEGLVVSASPDEGTRIPKDGTVDLVVSQGIEHLTVPSGLTGISVDDATAQLKGARFTDVRTEEQWSTSTSEGTVLSLSVSEGASLPHNAPITLVVSKGPEPVVVPQVTPLTLDRAKSELAPLDLSVVTTEEYSDTVPEGSVVSQSPEQGSPAHRGDEVTLTVSLGRPFVTVPDVIAKPSAEARKELEDAGFEVEVIKWMGFAGNEVRQQSAEPGTSLRKGSTITLRL